MATPVTVPGVHSQVGSETEFNISLLREFAGIEDPNGRQGRARPTWHRDQSPDKKVGPKAPSGLECAVSALLAAKRVQRQNEEKAAAAAAAEANGHAAPRKYVTTSASDVPAGKESPTSCFAGPGKDAAYASKFTAGLDILATKREEVIKPHCCHYTPQHTAGQGRPPAWEFGGRRPTQPRKRATSEARAARGRPEDDDGESKAFLTGIDTEEPSTLELAKPKAEMTAFARNTGFGDLGKIGRIHVLGHEVSHPADDLLQQDIKGQPKLRYPEWDFAKPQARKSFARDETLAPGHYDVKWAAVHGRPRIGVQYDKALSHSDTPLQNLGYSAPAAVLHAAWHQAPGGCVPDNRSYAKDSIRQRIVNVNDFDRELARPNLPPASKEYHNPRDPVASAVALANQLSYDADMADLAVTRRRDIGPSFGTMLPRGKAAVQGNRALSSDTAVRGAVGLGFATTERERKRSVEEGEARALVRSRSDVSCPTFARPVFYMQTHSKNNFAVGSAPKSRVGKVFGGPGLDSKQGSIRKPGASFKTATGFSRKAPAPGLCATTTLGRAAVDPKTRSHDAA